MDYIKEIKAFYVWLIENPLPGNAQALWHRLMAYANAFFWKEEFSVANIRLYSELEISRQEMDRVRNLLVQKGRIQYQKGTGNKAGIYRMIPLVSQKGNDFVTQDMTQDMTQPGHNPGTVHDASVAQSLRLACTLNKQIQDKDINNAKNTARASQLVDQDFQAAVKAYSENISTAVTPVIGENLQAGLDDTCLEAVLYAIEQAAIKDARNMGYVNAIIKSLRGFGVKDKLGLEAYKQQRDRQRAGGTSHGDTTPEPKLEGEF